MLSSSLFIAWDACSWVNVLLDGKSSRGHCRRAKKADTCFLSQQEPVKLYLEMPIFSGFGTKTAVLAGFCAIEIWPGCWLLFVSHHLWISMLIPAGFIIWELWEGETGEVWAKEPDLSELGNVWTHVLVSEDQGSPAGWDVIWKGTIRAMPEFCRNVVFLQNIFVLTNAILWSKVFCGEHLACHVLFSLYSNIQFFTKRERVLLIL